METPLSAASASCLLNIEAGVGGGIPPINSLPLCQGTTSQRRGLNSAGAVSERRAPEAACVPSSPQNSLK